MPKVETVVFCGHFVTCQAPHQRLSQRWLNLTFATTLGGRCCWSSLPTHFIGESEAPGRIGTQPWSPPFLHSSVMNSVEAPYP